MDIKYFLKRLKLVNIKDVKNDAKKLSKKLDKSYINILIDMAICNMKYGTTYKEYQWFEFYKLTDGEKRTFITEKINNEIIEKYNKKDDYKLLNDKGELYKRLNSYIRREYIDLREVSFKDFCSFINDKNIIVCKTVNDKDTKLECIEIEKDKVKNEYNILKIYNSIMKKEEYIVEEYLSEEKNTFNNIRFITFIDDNEKVIILNSIIRIKNGPNDLLEAIINDKGVICSYAVDKKGHSFIEHPKTYEKIKDYVVENYDEVVKIIKNIAKQTTSIRYASYDIMIVNNNIYLVNASACPKCFQLKPSISNKKEGELLKYKEYIK